MSQKPVPFCCRCKEEFPVAKEPTGWSMGQLRKLKYAPRKIKDQFRSWLKSDIHGESYLCGNCYFDLTDPDY